MARPREPIGVVHRAWFGVITVVYVVFLGLIPPFQTNDEDAHWVRAWAVAEGHLTCAPIPTAAPQLAAAFREVRSGARMTRARLEAARERPGHRDMRMADGAPCMYMPLSYVGPAILLRAIARPFHRATHLLLAFYAARTFNLVLLAVGVVLFMRAAPALRSLTLLLYSLPMAIQQSVSINQESTILCLAFWMIVLWWSRPSVRQTQLLLLAVTLLAITKPTYLVFLLLWAAALLRLRRAAVPVSWSRLALLALCGLVPIAMWAAWSYFVAARPEMLRMLPGWVDVPAQVAWVRSRPSVLWDVVTTQFRDLLGRDHLRGGWISVLGVLGWADYEIGDRAYRALLLAVPLAFVADLYGERADGDERRSFVSYVLPIVASALLIAGIAIALYFQFNGPRATFAMGMAGRYLHVPYFLSLTSVLLLARDRFPRARRPAVATGLEVACIALCLIAEHDAIVAIWTRYYAT